MTLIPIASQLFTKGETEKTAWFPSRSRDVATLTGSHGLYSPLNSVRGALNSPRPSSLTRVLQPPNIKAPLGERESFPGQLQEILQGIGISRTAGFKAFAGSAWERLRWRPGRAELRPLKGEEAPWQPGRDQVATRGRSSARAEALNLGRGEANVASGRSGVSPGTETPQKRDGSAAPEGPPRRARRFPAPDRPPKGRRPGRPSTSSAPTASRPGSH